LDCLYIYKIIEPMKNLKDDIKSKELNNFEINYSTNQTYTAEELDLIAVFFTLVKILFLHKSLNAILALSELIEPLRTGKELHQTTIRNEHAYYCCITQLLKSNPVGIGNGKSNPLIVIGDSHCLSPAWRNIKFGGVERELKPILATGVKIFHLRPESKFYPKKNFHNAVDSIEYGSDAIFLFGEIDCREGLVISVEKCRYENLDEGVETIVLLYIDILLDIVTRKNLRIFVHPVVPVLNETRHIVRIFNRILKEQLMKRNHPKILWMEFFGDLLDNEGNLKKEYELDGTHLNPQYLPLLEKSIVALI